MGLPNYRLSQLSRYRGFGNISAVTKHGAEILETECLIGINSPNFLPASSAIFYKRQSCVNLHFIPSTLFMLLPKNALTCGVLVPWLFGVALTCFYLHYISVAYFQPYTDDTEKSWAFGQIGAMITLAGPLYEGFRLARESAGRQHNEDFFLSNCQFTSVISDMGQDAGAWLLSCYSTCGAHVLLCTL